MNSSNPLLNHIPKYLYRYRTLEGAALFHAERTILHNEIYLTSPSKINDPFDCEVALDFDAADADWHKSLFGLSERKQPHLSKADHAAFAESTISSGRHKDKEIQSLILRELQEKVNSVGLLCLTERNDCILMWSHYAASHSGICFEFSNTGSDILIGQSQRVTYLQFYKKAHAIHDNMEAQVDRILRSKAKCWAYEAEWRKIDHQAGHGLKEFDPQILTGVIFGCKIAEANEKRIMKWLSERESPMNAYKARQSADGFHIEIERIVQRDAVWLLEDLRKLDKKKPYP